ncbi:cyclopropane-fatty-acyl-phospholipid synthase [Alteromonas sp. KC3]|uniref:SAM-dependent methyltransferase n=1 Tax=unclassified Alteromonas TaxID=2614992 RepID=UPI001924E2EE|nr:MULTISPECIES: cyclopropane-fatty-acyl-phospholipid synthase family protein [unclassified Alteromonas]BCO19763.1 cyclopropane-fatty-acyl-phospholipid synthase [Alteromonas sp. KC3]BCO23729.1 cyclopropane-fatty-acyl-phospholipid synthase [Alteromonas sp. KC14]
MSFGESVLLTTSEVSLADKVCRNLFLQCLKQLPFGCLIIQECGDEIARFGDDNDELRATVNIKDMSAYRRLLLGGSVGAGEAFMDDLWDSNDVTSVVRIFARNLPTLDKWESKFKWLSMPINKLQHFARRNTRDQAKKNIEAHYDLGNKLYTRFLDDTMMYSSAIYPDANTSLNAAQNYKLKTICDKLQLKESDHLIEIGTGWGGLAVYAAKHYGCKVTTTTISEEQHAWAQEWIAREGLSDRVTLLKKDYRLLEGKYDKLVSIEMIEAVGKQFLGNFFEKCSSLLKDNGLMLLQSITIDDRRYDSYSNSVDFIQKYIFPGGFLPSQYQLNAHLKKHTDMMIRDLHDIGIDYAMTLNHWYEAFISAKDELLKDGYDERFMRMWTYYLKYCEGGFLERTISTVQLVVSKPQFRATLAR